MLYAVIPPIRHQCRVHWRPPRSSSCPTHCSPPKPSLLLLLPPFLAGHLFHPPYLPLLPLDQLPCLHNNIIKTVSCTLLPPRLTLHGELPFGRVFEQLHASHGLDVVREYVVVVVLEAHLLFFVPLRGRHHTPHLQLARQSTVHERHVSI
jgi:hypothetical protein